MSIETRIKSLSPLVFQNPQGCPLEQNEVAVDPGLGTVPVQKPNFVLIQFDDLGFADWQNYGFGLAKTPNLTRLAARGVTAERYFSDSTVCSPSRYSIATGRHSAEDGIFTTILGDLAANSEYNNIHGIPVSIPTIYEQLSALGYATCHHGKWHMGFDPDGIGTAADYAIDEYSGWAFHGVTTPDASDAALLQSDIENWYRTRDQLVTTRVIDFALSNAADDKSFFAALSLNAPHYPNFPSDAAFAATDSLTERDNFAEIRDSDGRTPAQLYYAAVWDADALVGQVMDALDAAGLTDNTVIIVTSDNGPATNRLQSTSADQWGRVGNFRGYKGTTYNGGVRLPFIVAGPTIPAATKLTDATLSSVDIMPTMIHMAGGVPPDNVDGQIMLARWQGADVDRQKPLHWLTVQGLTISAGPSNRSPVIRGYYPAGTIGQAAWSVYSNEPGSAFERMPELYRNSDSTELDNYWRSMSAQCTDVANALLKANLNWYATLETPRLYPNAGRLEYRL